jgi:hypothetical protein
MTTAQPALATRGRLRCLAVLAYGVLRLTAPDKEALVERLAPGKRHFHALTNEEADLVIDELKRRAGQPVTRPQARERRRARGQADITLLITPAQKERLAELTRALIAAGCTSIYLEGVRLRACGRPFPVTSPAAEKAIEALKALQERRAREETRA